MSIKLRQGPMTAYGMLSQIKLVSLQLEHTISWWLLEKLWKIDQAFLILKNKYFVRDK